MASPVCVYRNPARRQKAVAMKEDTAKIHVQTDRMSGTKKQKKNRGY